ncbi:MAG: hypothetical protein LBR60_07690 [Fibrobacter sp.]|nr:hypothetical protein [Fibrobacter sp.]
MVALKKRIWILLLASAGFVWADGGVPLPRQTSYHPKGASMSLAIGSLKPSGSSCKRMLTWQGQGEFFYTSWMSAGLNIRMNGGNLDKEYHIIYQRYLAHARFYGKFSDNFVILLGPIVGFENTDLSRMRDEESDTQKADDDLCSDEYAMGGFSYGMEAGFGWKIIRDIGFVFRGAYEAIENDYSLVQINAGFAYNLRNHVDWLKRNLLGSWVSIEMAFYHYPETELKNWGKMILLGINFAI